MSDEAINADKVFSTSLPGSDVRRFKQGAYEVYAVFVHGKQAGQALCVPGNSKDPDACDVAAKEYAARYGKWPEGQKHIVMWNLGGRY